jgi:hypothetical protein
VKHYSQRIVAIVATSDSKGYWLVAATGGTFRYGDALRLATLSTSAAGSPIVGVATTSDGYGAWTAQRNGIVLRSGTAPKRGTLSKAQRTSLITAITAMPIDTRSSLQYPSGTYGYDISWPQCKGSTSSTAATLPGQPSYPDGTTAYTVAVVGVDGWGTGANNPCLSAEVNWAKRAKRIGAAPYELYMFLNSPSSSDTIDQSGPAGTCSNLASSERASCRAYNYGYNAAHLALRYAASEGASSSLWWLDIENDTCGEYWSCNRTLNSRTIQGAIDFLRSEKITVGVYSTSVQWKGITGGYVPTGVQIPIWVAGAYWTSPPYPSSYHYWSTSTLTPYCGSTYSFAHGKTWLLQETPGSNNYPFDPDYAC